MGRDLKEIPQEVLDSFIYDETSPSCLRWGVRPDPSSRVTVGSVAGCRDKNGYWVVKRNKTLYKVHRVIVSILLGKIPEGMVIDHINRNRSDNRIENLRITDWSTNSRNVSKHDRNKSGVTGVSLQSGKGDYLSWVAFVSDPKTKRDVRKTFGIKAYGYATAFNMAVKAREQMLEELRNNGFLYSDTHGK